MEWFGLEAEFAVFDHDAAVHDDVEAGGGGYLRGFLVFDAELEPERLGADLDGLAGDFRGLVGAAEDVDEVDGAGNVEKRGVGRLAKNLFLLGVDGDDLVADFLKGLGDAEAGAGGVGAESDDGDGAGLAEDFFEGAHEAKICWKRATSSRVRWRV